jgi:hypothetical protein
MNRFLLFFVFMLLFHSSEAQRFDWALEIGSTTWNYRSNCTAISYDSNQDCSYITGTQTAVFFVRKISATGATIWQKDFSSRLRNADITHDNQGNIYVLGEFKFEADMDPSTNPMDTFLLKSPFASNTGDPSDIFVLKLDSTGQFIWATMVARLGVCKGDAIEVDDNENVYISGSLRGVNFVQKFDPQGNSMWQHEFGTSNVIATWINTYHPKELTIDGNHIYFTGNYLGSVDFDPSFNSYFLQSNGEEDNFLLKLDLNGNFVWVTSFGNAYREYANAVAVDALGNVYTSGCFLAEDSILINGSYIPISQGPFYYLRKQNQQGQELWTNTIPQEILAIDASENGYLYVTGKEKVASSNTNIIIQKWETNNTLLWTQEPLSAYNDEGLDIAVDEDENVYTVGYFEGIVDFDLGTATHYLYATGTSDGFVLKLAAQDIAIPYLQSLEGVSLFPNPATGQIRINMEERIEEGRFELISSAGQILYQSQLEHSNYTDLDLSNYSQGVYLLRIYNKEKTSTLKFIKK